MSRGDDSEFSLPARKKRDPGVGLGSPVADALLAKIESGKVRIGIIGLGYVGLPLARAFSDRAIAVLGFDVDPAKIARLERGESYIGHISDAVDPPDARAQIRGHGRLPAAGRARRRDHLRADAAHRLARSGSELYHQFDQGHCRAPAAWPARGARKHHVPGDDPRSGPADPGRRRGCKPGVDFFLAFSPEREDPGNPQFSAPTIPKVVGGLEPASLELAVALYGKVVVRVVPVSSPEVAEACKILENTYRSINIALVNELKMIYSKMGIDVWEVIEAAKTKPFGFQAFYPGPGLGGHCIPIDPFYLTWVARKHGLATQFIELAGEINTSMPGYVVSKVADALNDALQIDQGERDHAPGHGV